MRSEPFPRWTPEQRDFRRRARMRALGQQGRPEVADGVPSPLFAEQRAMARPGTSSEKTAKNVPAPPSAAVIATTRAGFGPRPGDIEAFNALGVTDAQRLEAWIDQQLDPGSIDDSAADTRLGQSEFTTLGKSLEQLYQEHSLHEEWEIRMQPFWETQLATFVRAIHSKRQLLEVMTDFWHNHFNVFADEEPFGSVWVHTDRDAIRAHGLGNFRQLVEAVTRTPAMLFYLDNAYNSSEDANENFARELLELHTLGADSYLGSMPQNQVPVDGNGWPTGWVEDDVIAAAKCLTGWTVESTWVHWEFADTGTFLYWDDWHDHSPKTVIGLNLPANQGAMQDGWDFLDRICQHPATAQHIAGKLCRRLLGDFSSQSVIDTAAAVFQANFAAPDQLAQTIRAIVLSPEYLTTWGDKVKRPFELAMSAFRGAGGDLPFKLQDDPTNWFYWTYYQTGQPLFSWHPPNGYPDIKAAWNTTSPRVMSWRLMNMLVQVYDDVSETYFFDLLAQTPAGVRSAQQLVEFWSIRILGRPMPQDEADKLVAFMAQGAAPTDPLPLDSEWDVQDRLRALVALILMSPSFLWR